MTIDINELRRLAQAALIGPDGVSLRWLKLLKDFQEEANPAAISELIDRLEAAEKERDEWLAGFDEWLDKTKWVQQGINEGTISAKYLGLHRADIMTSLLGEAEKERDALRTKIKAMEQQRPVRLVFRSDELDEQIKYATDPAWAEAFEVPEGMVALYALPGAKGEAK